MSIMNIHNLLNPTPQNLVSDAPIQVQRAPLVTRTHPYLVRTNTPAISTEMIEWYKDNATDFYTDKPDKLAGVMYQNALELFPGLRRRLGW